MKKKERIKQLESKIERLEMRLELIEKAYRDALHDRNVVEMAKVGKLNFMSESQAKAV